MFRVALLLIALVAAVGASAQVTFEAADITVDSNGRSHRFQIEMAVTEAQRGQGLMFRKTLPADGGMLFIFPRNSRQAMWMKNTLVPLDMLFLTPRGVVKHIAERTVPLSTDAITSGGRVKAILELQGGTVARLGLRKGDRVRHPMLE